MPELKILIVDDSATMRKIVKHQLGRLGYSNVVEAENGRQGLEKLSQEPVDLVILDWNMPEMNGLQFVQTVRANEAFKDLPILMLTTVSTPDEVMAAIKAGVNGYIAKPFTGEVLQEKISQVLN